MLPEGIHSSYFPFRTFPFRIHAHKTITHNQSYFVLDSDEDIPHLATASEIFEIRTHRVFDI